MSRAEMIIRNLRHRGITRYEIEAEVNHRKENILASDERCFGYTSEELKCAMEHWHEY